MSQKDAACDLSALKFSFSLRLSLLPHFPLFPYVFYLIHPLFVFIHCGIFSSCYCDLWSPVADVAKYEYMLIVIMCDIYINDACRNADL